MRAAQIVSIVFHPLLLTTYLVVLLGQWMPAMLLVRQEHLLTFVAFIFGITFVLPALNVLVFRQFGMIASWRMGTRQERILPFVFNSLVYLLIAILFIIFDLEVSFLFPWAVAFGQLGAFGFWSMMLFLGVLTIGFIYEWKKGALEWD